MKFHDAADERHHTFVFTGLEFQGGEIDIAGDVEAIFFVPWALAYRKFLNVNAFILFEMVFFIAILLAGDIYIYRKGVLEWD